MNNNRSSYSFKAMNKVNQATSVGETRDSVGRHYRYAWCLVFRNKTRLYHNTFN